MGSKPGSVLLEHDRYLTRPGGLLPCAALARIVRLYSKRV